MYSWDVTFEVEEAIEFSCRKIEGELKAVKELMTKNQNKYIKEGLESVESRLLKKLKTKLTEKENPAKLVRKITGKFDAFFELRGWGNNEASKEDFKQFLHVMTNEHSGVLFEVKGLPRDTLRFFSGEDCCVMLLAKGGVVKCFNIPIQWKTFEEVDFPIDNNEQR